MLQDMLRQYGLVLIFTLVAIIMPTSMLVLSWLFSRLGIRPHRPSKVKYDLYESGMELVGGRWSRFHFRYYVYAIIFVLFDVEVVFLYPWAVRFNKLGLFALIEVLVFIAILLVAWAYAWRKQDLEWR